VLRTDQVAVLCFSSLRRAQDRMLFLYRPSARPDGGAETELSVAISRQRSASTKTMGCVRRPVP
jgi:hypothetical protein